MELKIAQDLDCLHTNRSKHHNVSIYLCPRCPFSVSYAFSTATTKKGHNFEVENSEEKTDYNDYPNLLEIYLTSLCLKPSENLCHIKYDTEDNLSNQSSIFWIYSIDFYLSESKP